MSGNVVIEDGRTRAHFTGGRFSDFTSDNTSVLMGVPSSAYVVIGGEKIDFTQESVFSFQGSRARVSWFSVKWNFRIFK
jgi:hypothetical protein